MRVSSKHVSNENKRRGRTNIARKMRILRHWTRGGIPWKITEDGHPVRDARGEKVLDWYPQKIEHFLNWTGTQNCPAVQATINSPEVEPLRTTRHDALKKNPELAERIEKLLGQLRNVADKQLKKSDKSNEIDELKTKLDETKSKLREAVQSYQRDRKALREAQEVLEQEKIAHQQDNVDSEREIGWLKAEIENLKARNSELTRKLAGMKRYPHPIGD